MSARWTSTVKEKDANSGAQESLLWYPAHPSLSLNICVFGGLFLRKGDIYSCTCKGDRGEKETDFSVFYIKSKV